MNRELRFLIVAFDGLRPDMVRDEIAPNLVAFRREGVHFQDCRSVFPSETRVNQATLVTGCHPAGHGIVANKFVEAEYGGYLNTTDFEQLTTANEVLNGELLTVPSLGEVLHASGGSLAVIGCGTAGGNRLLHNHAESLAALNISLHGIDKSTTPIAASALVEKFGAIPDAAIPNLARMDWVVDAYLQEVAPNRDPTVTILWFSDPDTPYHYRGINSPEAVEGIRHADAAFGRLLAWRREVGREDTLQIVAMSDHGHVATYGPALDVGTQLEGAGFRLGANLTGDVDAAFVPGTTASLYVRDAAVQAAIAQWLQGQPWCGTMFARTMENSSLPMGTLPLASCHLDHRRAGDLVFSLARDGEPGPGQLPGRCLHDNPDIPVGCGLHGGLSPYELNSCLAMSGSCFAKSRDIANPVGLVDIMPTLSHLLELSDDQERDGRVLVEALSAPDGQTPSVTRHEFSAESDYGYRQCLTVDEVDGVRYLVSGERQLAGPIERLIA